MNDAAYNELTSFNDQELAHFVKGRLPHLEPSAQRELRNYVQQVRKLSEENIRYLAAERIPQDKFWKSRCSRCGSTRLELEKYKKACLICCYSTSRNELLKVLSFLAAFFQG